MFIHRPPAPPPPPPCLPAPSPTHPDGFIEANHAKHPVSNSSLNFLPPLPPQLPERHELWYDDGTAEPEFYYDRDWLQSNGQAALELVGALGFIFGTVGAFAYYIDDGFRPVRVAWCVGIIRRGAVCAS
mgnify:CR=1 FL=1